MKVRAQSLSLEALEDRTLLATCTVTKLLDVGRGGMSIGSGQVTGDLRFCINQANAIPGPDVIDISATGTINLRGALPSLSSDIDLQGPGAALLTLRRGSGGNYGIFTIAGGTVEINGLTISEGYAQFGGGIYNQGDLSLDDVVIDSNLGYTNAGNGRGGGIYNAGTLTIQNSVVTDNHVSGFPHGNNGYGGGIYNTGTLTLIASAVSNNEASGQSFGGQGPGIFNSATGTLTVIDSTIDSNTGFGEWPTGGGINNYGGSASIYNSTISNNELRIDGDGGGIFTSGPMVLFNSTVSNNRSDGIGFGGGILAVSSPFVLISHSTISDNRDTSGPGGLYIQNSFVYARNSIFANQSATGGADIHGTLTASDHNLFRDSSGGGGYSSTDILDVDPMLGSLQNNGGPTHTVALLPGSPAIDGGDNADAPEFDQRGPGFPRIVNDTIDIGAFEVQATDAPTPPHFIAFLITADMHELESVR